MGEGLAGYKVFRVFLFGEGSAVEIGGADEVYGGHLELFVEEVPEGHPEYAVLGEIMAELFAELGGPFRGVVGPVSIPLFLAPGVTQFYDSLAFDFS